MQTMDTTAPLADTREMSEHQTEKRVSTAPNDSFSHTKKYAKSHVKSQIKTTTPNFTSENPFSILQTEHDALTPTASAISTSGQEKKTFPPNITTSRINYSMF
jgi:hypothetical protein